jgi:DNA-binding transcriptional ArsR family regulator
MYAWLLIFRAVDEDGPLRALANENRRRILRLIRDEHRSVGELADQLGLSQPAVSQHLAVLRRSGLVRMLPVGRRRLYRADNEAVAAAGRFFAEYWDDPSRRPASPDEGHQDDRAGVEAIPCDEHRAGRSTGPGDPACTGMASHRSADPA